MLKCFQEENEFDSDKRSINTFDIKQMMSFRDSSSSKTAAAANRSNSRRQITLDCHNELKEEVMNAKKQYSKLIKTLSESKARSSMFGEVYKKGG